MQADDAVDASMMSGRESDALSGPQPDGGSKPSWAGFALTLERHGAFGFCISQGMFHDVDIRFDDVKDVLVLSGRVHAGWADDCTAGADCQRTSAVERVLTAEQHELLATLLDPMPPAGCTAPVSPACDPCLIQVLTHGDTEYRIDPCTPNPCDSYAGTMARLTTFIDDLASDQASNAENCFSPTQHLELATPGNVAGCSCEWHGQSACVEGNALICERRGEGERARWIAVIDGPCWPRHCEPEARIADVEACLLEHRLCYQLPGGEVCPSSF